MVERSVLLLVLEIYDGVKFLDNICEAWGGGAILIDVAFIT